MAGCYRSRGLGDADGGVRRRDAARADAARRGASPVDASPVDTGHTTMLDAGEEPLPTEPDRDLGPDARPSDYVDAGSWEDPDPSAHPADEPCCTLIGEAQTLDMGGDGVGTVALAWNGRGWGLL